MRLYDANWWVKEVKRRAYPLKERIIRIVRIAYDPIVFILIFLSAYLTIFLPEGGSIGPFQISTNIVRWFQFMGVVITGTLGLITVRLHTKEPGFTRYQRIAIEIVREMEKDKCLTKVAAEEMKKVINSRLVACTNSSIGKRQADSVLSNTAEKLAEIYKKCVAPSC